MKQNPYNMRNRFQWAKGCAAALLLTLFLAPNCSLQILPPASMRFNAAICVLDTTETGADRTVADAVVLLQSITYGDRLETISDSAGMAYFTDILPDRYNLLVSGRRVSITEIILINGQLQDTALFVAENDTLFLDVYAQTSRTSALLISEIYYSGAPPKPIPQYYHDQFLEIYNNSNITLYLDSLIISDTEAGFQDDSLIHAIHAYMFPGSGSDYPIGPGEFIVVAQDAIDHSQAPVNSVNLLDANFEYYVSDQGDVDNPGVPNMIQLHHKYGIDFLYSVFNDALVILKVKDPYALGYDEFNRLMLPKSGVIDGVEYRENTSQFDWKRLDASIDAGLAGGIPGYSNKSVERRIERMEEGRFIFMDNNNSSLDFIILSKPTPGFCNQEVPQ
ncbi:MAG: DUF4876 domain-containing protein [Candidatus Marinimicrobia bacterium]|nr:DUF4876 domain-containing protein [Candidatus Neomarinimicrobiota bacterium]